MSESHDDDRIDFSALDPSRDRARWEQQIAAVTARALAARRGPQRADGLRFWSRPGLAAAAALALITWGATALRGCTPSARPAAAQPNPIANVISWSRGGTPTNAYELLEVIHGE